MVEHGVAVQVEARGHGGGVAAAVQVVPEQGQVVRIVGNVLGVDLLHHGMREAEAHEPLVLFRRVHEEVHERVAEQVRAAVGVLGCGELQADGLAQPERDLRLPVRQVEVLDALENLRHAAVDAQGAAHVLLELVQGAAVREAAVARRRVAECQHLGAVREAVHIAAVQPAGRPHRAPRLLGVGPLVHLQHHELVLRVGREPGHLPLRVHVLARHRLVLQQLLEEEVVGYVQLHLRAPLLLAQRHDMAYQDAEQVLQPFGKRRDVA